MSRNRTLTKDVFSQKSAEYLLTLYRLARQLPEPKQWAAQGQDFQELFYCSDLHDSAWLQLLISRALSSDTSRPSRAQRRIRRLEQKSKLVRYLEELCLLDVIAAIYDAHQRWNLLAFQYTQYDSDLMRYVHNTCEPFSEQLGHTHPAMVELGLARNQLHEAYREVINLKYPATNQLWSLQREIMEKIFDPVPPAWRIPELFVSNSPRLSACAALRRQLQPCRSITQGSYLQRIATINAEAEAGFFAATQLIAAADQRWQSALVAVEQAVRHSEKGDGDHE